MEENIIKTDFAYTDEFGQESRITKTFTDAVFMDKTSLEFLVDEFKNFLMGIGLTPETVNKIDIVEDED